MKFFRFLIVVLLVGCRHHERRPLNLLLITLDSTRADHLGCYDRRSAASPAIDKLAASGLRFLQVDATVPATLPSHATLLTGLLPQRHGLRIDGSGMLRTGIETLATVFARRGFHTAAFIGSSALDRRFGLGRGFGVYDEPAAGDERAAGAVADSALRWLRDERSRPFFAWIHFYDPHAPYEPPQPYRSRFVSLPYDGEIAHVDSQVARIVNDLERANLLDNTVIAIVGDHGEGLGEHGEATHGLLLYESTLRVPLIIAGPSLKPHIVREAISTADVPPTLAGLVRVPMNVVRLYGRDLSADLLSGREPAPRDIYAETEAPRATGGADVRSFRRDGRKLISGAHDELYDVDHDPHETVDLIDADRGLARELAAGLAPLRQQATPLPATSTDAPALVPGQR